MAASYKLIESENNIDENSDVEAPLTQELQSSRKRKPHDNDSVVGGGKSPNPEIKKKKTTIDMFFKRKGL